MSKFELFALLKDEEFLRMLRASIMDKDEVYISMCRTIEIAFKKEATHLRNVYTLEKQNPSHDYTYEQLEAILDEANKYDDYVKKIVA